MPGRVRARRSAARAGVLGEAGQRLEQLDVAWPDLAIDRYRVLLAARLTSEAQDEADRAVVQMDKNGGQPTTRAELLFTAATWRWPRRIR